jgi:hypothetical protein
MSITSSLLATFVMVFHIVIVMFTLLAPFTDSTGLLILHITWSITLLVHWIGNSNACSLTLLESKFRGVESCETFMHRLISPFYDIPEGVLSKICYIMTVLLMLFSMYKLYVSKKFNAIIVNIRNGDNVMKNMKLAFAI